MAKHQGAKPPATRPGEPQNVEESIRRRAYELYEKRGKEGGHEVEDWLRAEEEVTKKKIHVVAV